MRVRDVGEFGLIDRLAAIAGRGDGDVVAGIGDDTAALRPTPGHLLLATCDVQIDGVHFIADRAPPGDVGHKALAVNLSDVAAMGGRPRWALVSLGVAPGTRVGYLEELYRGMRRLADRHGVVLVGGNVSRAGGAIFVDVTLLGEVEPAALVRRSGANVGDLIAVTGTLGDAAAGLALALERPGGVDERTGAYLLDRQRRPTPRVEAGRALAASGVVTAMMDVSDGLGQDLAKVCEAGGVGAEVEEARLPLSTPLLAMAEATGLDPVRAALTGGEDYELLVTIRPDGLASAQEVARGARTPLRQIGTIVDGGLILIGAEGRRLPLETAGHDHGRAAPAVGPRERDDDAPMAPHRRVSWPPRRR